MTQVVEHVATLTAAESDLLAVCEATISRGLQTFRAVGDALIQVRDNRLYRAEFATFEEYAEQRWGISKAHANRLVAAASVAAILAPIGVEIKNEAQARELAPLIDDPEEMRAAFTEAVKRSDGKPAAAAIREVVRERMDPEGELAKVANQELDKAEERRRMIEEHNAHVADVRKDITPEREAEILDSVRPQVEFVSLVDACRQFLEMVARIDLAAASRGFSADKASPLQQVLDLLPTLRALEAQA